MSSRESTGSARAAQRRLVAAVNVAGAGLALIVLPYIVKLPALTAALQLLATIGWLLLVAGTLVLVIALRRKATEPAVPQAGRAAVRPPVRQLRRPSGPASQVERIEPVDGPSTRHTILAGTPLIAPASWRQSVFAVIEWRRFEAVVEALCAQAGFLTKAQSHGPDEGIDVWLYSKNQPDGAPVSVVQCKILRDQPSARSLRLSRWGLPKSSAQVGIMRRSPNSIGHCALTFFWITQPFES